MNTNTKFTKLCVAETPLEESEDCETCPICGEKPFYFGLCHECGYDENNN